MTHTRGRVAARRSIFLSFSSSPCFNALRRHALRRHVFRRRSPCVSQSRPPGLASQSLAYGHQYSFSNQLLINTTSGYGIHATASRPSQLKVSLRRQNPAGLGAGGTTTMPETPVKCHHTRWQSSHPPSCTRLISQRLDAASVELWSATHWLPVGQSCGPRRTGLHCSHKLIDDLVQLKDPHNGATC